jgi:hypothetical protein
VISCADVDVMARLRTHANAGIRTSDFTSIASHRRESNTASADMRTKRSQDQVLRSDAFQGRFPETRSFESTNTVGT